MRAGDGAQRLRAAAARRAEHVEVPERREVDGRRPPRLLAGQVLQRVRHRRGQRARSTLGVRVSTSSVAARRAAARRAARAATGCAARARPSRSLAARIASTSTVRSVTSASSCDVRLGPHRDGWASCGQSSVDDPRPAASPVVRGARAAAADPAGLERDQRGVPEPHVGAAGRALLDARRRRGRR